MGNQSSRSYYVAFEGGIYAGVFALSFAAFIFVAVILFFVPKSRKFFEFLYSILFRLTVQETKAPGQEQPHFLYNGYNKVRYSCMLHTYFLLIIFAVFNLGAAMFVDNFFYRKTTTCNDLNVRNDAYQCFNAEDPLESDPVNCDLEEIKNDLDVRVICYLQSSSLAVALSLSFSFIQFVLIPVQVSFSLTLWCVKNNCIPAIIILHLIIFIVSLIGAIVYGTIVWVNVNNVQYSPETNIFYGLRIMRIFMFIWALITGLIVTCFSPYNWLLEKDSGTNEYPTKKYPSYS